MTTSIDLGRPPYIYEIEHLLARAGFTQLEFFRSFDREPWTAGAEIIALARA